MVRCVRSENRPAAANRLPAAGPAWRQQGCVLSPPGFSRGVYCHHRASAGVCTVSTGLQQGCVLSPSGFSRGVYCHHRASAGVVLSPPGFSRGVYCHHRASAGVVLSPPGFSRGVYCRHRASAGVCAVATADGGRMQSRYVEPPRSLVVVLVGSFVTSLIALPIPTASDSDLRSLNRPKARHGLHGGGEGQRGKLPLLNFASGKARFLHAQNSVRKNMMSPHAI